MRREGHLNDENHTVVTRCYLSVSLGHQRWVCTGLGRRLKLHRCPTPVVDLGVSLVLRNIYLHVPRGRGRGCGGRRLSVLLRRDRPLLIEEMADRLDVEKVSSKS